MDFHHDGRTFNKDGNGNFIAAGTALEITASRIGTFNQSGGNINDSSGILAG